VFAIVNALDFVLGGLITLSIWIVIAAAIMSWLVAGGVINLRNPSAYRFVIGLDRAAGVLLSPIRRFVPTFGGLDISPIIYILIAQAVRIYLLPEALKALLRLSGAALI
jgi:YggT family protein